jgi:hypothetical protein
VEIGKFLVLVLLRKTRRYNITKGKKMALKELSKQPFNAIFGYSPFSISIKLFLRS